MTDTFTFSASGIGEIRFELLDPARDAEQVHAWVSQPYARYWGMQDQTPSDVQASYQRLQDKTGFDVFLGLIDGEPGFLMERYDPATDPIAESYDVLTGDVGMHLLIAPADAPIKGFSTAVMQSIMAFLFDDPAVQRVVVEPDYRNHKVHALNRRVGFFHTHTIMIGEKKALFGSCTRAQFAAALATEARRQAAHNLPHKALDYAAGPGAMLDNPAQAAEAITPAIWSRVNRHLVRKAIAELAHERILEPIALRAEAQTYQLLVDTVGVEYTFKARRLALDHWLVDADSIERRVDGEPVALDAIAFIIDVRSRLGIAKERFPIYLEEITSTLCSAAYKQFKPHLSAPALATADFQTIETEMTEGHPCFIANNGRIGFDAGDYRAFAPEAGAPVTLLWLAAHKSRAHFAAVPDLDADQLFAQELDFTLRERFRTQLIEQGLQPEDFWLMPVHPWQWFNKLASVYAPEIAARKLVMLGYGDDCYTAQQSIRTFFNCSQPHKRYVKTALSILNMGFMRGLSAYYMRATPAINQWLRDLLDQDDYLQCIGFDMLREVASVGYEIPYYDRALVGDNPYRRMLAALWRENPYERLESGQRLMTMAALLHVDENNEALLPALIQASGLSVQAWISRYLQAYLTPLLHCFYRYKLVFMPHGENLILILENHVPVGVFMKDIGEEICLQNTDADLPEDVARIAIELPPHMELLGIFTDVFDCYFRFLTAVLEEHTDFTEHQFWAAVADCVYAYQDQFPDNADRYREFDLFAPDFSHSCLNRLQLKNNLQMVNLENPAESLTFSGRLENPIARFRRSATVMKPALECEAV
ncbi:GNAT family N-acetyltransferase [Simiduia agarivorans]|uniref:Siderophore biosynthesis protein n=1 Tax=Simiduia agarivorans (strain DSM 21679 / JCM 13881 / BCRC 17597 / SA1) TaxID=1117647 RepID=K4KHA1_SIMAS|nr:GNAT family N-acetyltransferase [Simiduia agarivorans]AFU98484.2 siderophore biosynthesis protein [Simiduia agarivorans SA1 = DSM 21679]